MKFKIFIGDESSKGKIKGAYLSEKEAIEIASKKNRIVAYY